MQVRIPCDSATAQYWNSLGSPLDVQKHDILYAALIIAALTESTPNTPTTNDPLAPSVTLKAAPDYVAQFCKDAPSVVAGILARLWREDLFKTVYAAYALGMPFKESIMQFCATHNIAVDVDINYDALERKFRRDVKKKQGEKRCFFLENMRRNVLILSNKMQRAKQAKTHLSDDKLEHIAKSYFNQNEDLFYTKRGTPRKKLYFQLRLYVYHQVGARSHTYIIRRFKIPSSNLYHNVNSFKAFLAVAPPIEAV